MIPRLYPASETAFTTLGLGALYEAESCTVSESLNGDEYVLDMVYPSAGGLAAEIISGAVIGAIAHDGDTTLQPFDITQVETTIDGRMSIHAEHVTRRLAYLVCHGDTELVTTAPQAAMERIQANTIGHTAADYPITLSSAFSVSSARTFRILDTATVWDRLLGAEGSVLDLFGGEWAFDRFSARLVQARGKDTGVRVSYGKNITDITQETNWTNTYTSIVPTCSTTDRGLVIYSGGYVDAPTAAAFPFRRFLAVDFADALQLEDGAIPTDAQLKAAAEAYISSNAIGVPEVSISVDYRPLWQMSGYDWMRDLERVGLGDTVTVLFPALGVNAKAKVRRTVYDVLRDRYENIQIGTVKQTLAKTIYQMSKGRSIR